MIEYLFCIWAGGYIVFVALAYCIDEYEQYAKWDWFGVLTLLLAGAFWPIAIPYHLVGNRLG